MALANYTDLLAAVEQWINRTDFPAAIIPDIVTIAEGRIGRDLRLRQQLTSDTLTCSTTTRAVALPTDWLEFENLSIGSTTGTEITPLQYVTIEHLDQKYPEDGWSAKPYVYTIEGENVLFGPQPDAAYIVNILYYARFGALATETTNWLMTNHPMIYLSACLFEASMYIMDEERAAYWGTIYDRNVATLQGIDERSTHSGSALRVKAI